MNKPAKIIYTVWRLRSDPDVSPSQFDSFLTLEEALEAAREYNEGLDLSEVRYVVYKQTRERVDDVLQ